MISKVIITPKFNIHEWTRKKIETNWMDFQNRALRLGQKIHSYMISYIMAHKKRAQSPHLDGTLPLEKSIQLHIISTAPARIEWGIGHIPSLQAQSPHWYVINYGKTVSGRRFIPGGGKGIPGYFQPSGAPNASKKNGGEPFIYSPNTFLMYPKRAIRPINYIQSSQFKLGNEFRQFQLKRYQEGLNTQNIFDFIKKKIEHYANDLGDMNLLLVLQSQAWDVSYVDFHELHDKLKSLNLTFRGQILISYNESDREKVINQVYPDITTTRIPVRYPSAQLDD